MKTIYIGTVGVPGGKASVTGNGEGVYAVRLDEDFRTIGTTLLKAPNAGILTSAPDRKTLYAANETKDFTGLNGSGGGVTAIRAEETLEKINDSVSYGSRTAYVSLSEDGRYLLAANHGSHTTVTCSYVPDEEGNWVLQRGFDDSSVASFRIREDGGIGELCSLQVMKGSGYWCHGGGQSTSHVHCVKVRGNLVFACNRGADKIEVFRLKEDGKLELLERNQAPYGYAPRHIDFHPAKKFVYVANENYPSLSVYAYTEEGKMEELQRLGTMPDAYYEERPLPAFTKPHSDPDEKNTCGFADRGAAMPADIHCRADGKFVYVSNRHRAGTGSIAVFAVREDGTLKNAGHLLLEGKDPRGFQITSDGKYLFACLLDENRIDVFELSEESGLALRKVSRIDVPSPSSLILW